MGNESGPRGYEPLTDSAELSADDKALEAAVLNDESSRGLYDLNAVAWLRAAIGVDTGRGASEISDLELAARYTEYGLAEWDPHIKDAVAKYLRSHGFIGFPTDS